MVLTTLPEGVFIHDVEGQRVESHWEVECVLFTPERIKVLPHRGCPKKVVNIMLFYSVFPYMHIAVAQRCRWITSATAISHAELQIVLMDTPNAICFIIIFLS